MLIRIERGVMMIRKLTIKNRILLKLILILIYGFITSNNSFASNILTSTDKTGSCKTMRTMARVYMSAGDYTKAQSFAENALKIAKTNNISENELCSCYVDL